MQQIMMTADDANNADAADANTNEAGNKKEGSDDPFYDGNLLTNRFKYKVNALMGSYDPIQGDTDTEQTDGNILNALLQFPTLYSFNIVGRTGGDDESIKDAYVQQVKSIVVDGCGGGGDSEDGGGLIADTRDTVEDTTTPTVMGGDADDKVVAADDEDDATANQTVEMDDTVVCVVKPRGANFTKITVEVRVESAAMINSVYDELGALERTVMRF